MVDNVCCVNGECLPRSNASRKQAFEMGKYRKRMVYTTLLVLCLFGFSIKSFVRRKSMELSNLTDGIDLSFAHAVNSEAKLTSSLSDSTVMILEADVLNDPVRNIPIMAHPPATSSDISLMQFLTRVLLYSPPKGIKLDFKQIEVVEPSLKILDALQEEHQRIPPMVMLNADILVGPENPSNLPLNASKFLELCSKYDKRSILSLGWTTTKAKYRENPQGYTWGMVQEMHNTVKGMKQRVTFPVRGALVAISRDQLLWLLNRSINYSLTIWHSTVDNYDVQGMAFLRSKEYIDKVYYDLPDEKIKILRSISVT